MRRVSAIVLVAGVCPAHLGDSVVRDDPFVTAVVRWIMPQVCPKVTLALAYGLGRAVQ